MNARAAALAACAALGLVAPRAAGGEAVPVMVRTAPGRFEVAAVDSARAHAIVAEAEEAWRWLAGPFELPAEFSSPVFVRVAAAAEPFAVTAEIGGVVSLRLAETADAAQIRRGLVQALLLRLAVARHGFGERLHVPRWLEEAGVVWWRTRAAPAQLDALRQAGGRLAPPPLVSLLEWRHGVATTPALSAGAHWLLAALLSESGRAREWPALLGALLRGDEPQAALAASFPGRFSGPAERELWWQVIWHQAMRARLLPAQTPAESRAALAAVARFVFSGATGDADTVVPLAAVLARAAEPIVAADLPRRADALARLVPVLHPFYRNAGLSLAEALASRDARAAKREAAAAAFEQDWRDALELEAASSAALDALERR